MFAHNLCSHNNCLLHSVKEPCISSDDLHFFRWSPFFHHFWWEQHFSGTPVSYRYTNCTELVPRFGLWPSPPCISSDDLHFSKEKCPLSCLFHFLQIVLSFVVIGGVAVCCSVLQCCSALKCVAVLWLAESSPVNEWVISSLWIRHISYVGDPVCCSVLQCGAVWCSVAVL